MKVAIFTDSFIPGYGGTEKAVLGLAQGLTDRGNKVLVVCPNYDKTNDDSQYKFEVLRVPNLYLVAGNYFAFPNLSKNLKNKILEFNPDIIHIQSVSPMARSGIKYAKKLNIPAVMTIHTKFRECFGNYIKLKFIINLILKDLVKKCNMCNQVYTVSNDMKKELAGYGYKNEVKVIRNGAMFELVTNKEENKLQAVKKYNLEKNYPTLLYVGHIIKYKNLEFLLNCFKLLKDKNFKFQALFIGHGPDFKFFKKKAVELGLNNEVTFTNVITDKKLLSSLYSCGDLLTFPSIFDNDPLVVVEAAAHCVPAITIKDTGSSERLEDNVSGFIEECNEEKFTNRIIQIFEDKNNLKQTGINASKMIPKQWSQTAKEYEINYKLIINNK